MKKLFAMMLTSAAITTGAFANAGPAPCPACPEQPVAKWGGWWLGAQLGYAHGANKANWRSGDFNAAADFVVNNNLSTPGVFGGIHGAYQWQFNKNWMLGLGVDIDWTGMSGKNELFDPANVAAVGRNYVRMNADWTIAVVPTLSYVMNDSRFYVGAGWAGTEWNLKGRNATVVANGGTQANARFSSDKFLSAFRLEIGASQRMNRMVATVAGTYDWYGSISAGRTLNVANGDQFTRVSVKPRVLSAKVKLSYML